MSGNSMPTRNHSEDALGMGWVCSLGVVFSGIWLYIDFSIPARPLPVLQASPNVAGFSFLGLL